MTSCIMILVLLLSGCLPAEEAWEVDELGRTLEDLGKEMEKEDDPAPPSSQALS